VDSSPNGISIDVTSWPIVGFTLRGAITDDEFERLFVEVEKYWRRGDRFLTITDTRAAANASARQRQRIGEWMKENQASIRQTSIGSIVILQSVIVRGALTAINWIAQPELPPEYAKDWAQASELATRMLERHDMLTDKLRLRLQRLA